MMLISRQVAHLHQIKLDSWTRVTRGCSVQTVSRYLVLICPLLWWARKIKITRGKALTADRRTKYDSSGQNPSKQQTSYWAFLSDCLVTVGISQHWAAFVWFVSQALECGSRSQLQKSQTTLFWTAIGGRKRFGIKCNWGCNWRWGRSVLKRL